MGMIQAISGPMQKWFGRDALDWLLGSSSEKAISSRDTLTLPAIWNGVSRIAGHVSQLPINVYEATYDGDEKVGGKRSRSHNAHWLMMRRPNAYQTPVVFREQVSKDSLLDGNGRAALIRSGTRIMEMIPLDPNRTVTAMVMGEKYHATRPGPDDRLRLFYETENTDKHCLILLTDSEVLHIPGLSDNGISGIALKDIGRRNLGMSIAAEKRLGTQMEKGFAGNLMLEAPPGVFAKQADAEEFLDAFEKRHSSPDKAGKVGMLRNGLKANLLAMNNKDAEMTDLRKFARQDAALWLGLEQILGDDSSVSYNSLEQKLLAYLMNCLNRWLKRWEEEIEWKLLSKSDFAAERYYVRFNTAALLKSDFKTTIESLSQAITSTIISPNEARSKLDMNPRDGGDTFANPAITPGQADTEPTSADDPKDNQDETQPTNATRKATQVLFGRLVGIEAKRAVSAAEKSKNFCNWIDSFYAKWETKLAGDIEAVGGDRDLATTHCAESKARLLRCADESTQETLAGNVSKCVASWSARAITLAEEMELSNV